MCKKILSIVIFAILSLTVYSQHSDGTHCATVDRYNPRTYKQSSYRQTVSVKNNHVVRLDWPSGGHLDTDHFEPASIVNRVASFSDDKGNQYKVKILKRGGDCFEGFPDLVQCSGTTKKGERCKNKTGNSNGKCWRHKAQVQ